jgi:hypothetical protein
VTVQYEVVPKTLPRLRYGHTYVMRGRPVDLAGNSHELDDANPKRTTTRPALFARLAPITPPDVIRRGIRPIPGIGDFPTTLVVLSDYNVPDDRAITTERVLFPPRIGQQRVELHGLPNGGVDPRAYDELAERDPRSFLDHTLLDPTSGERVVGVVANRRIRPGPPNPVAEYLVDPAAQGPSFTGLPQSPVSTLVLPWTGKWPDSRAVHLIANGGDQPPKIRRGAKGIHLDIFIPKSETHVVDLSNAIRGPFLSHFGIFGMQNRLNQGKLRRGALDGTHWMLSARSQITLIHAVRRPLLPPAVAALTATRPNVGSSLVQLTGTLSAHLASTERAALTCVYIDPVDNPAAPSPGVQTRTATLGDVPVTAPAGATGGVSPGEAAIDLLPSLHDTKRHRIRVKAEAFSRFTRYFTQQKQPKFTTSKVTLSRRGVIATSVVLSNPRTGETYQPGTDYLLDAEKGTVTRRNSGAIPAGGTVKALFIALPVSRVSTEGAGSLFEVDVPNSLPPAALHIHDVVPAYSAEGTDTSTLITRRRNGRVLRFYLERGWYSTGAGEELGVILDTNPGDIPESTRYGRDPVNKGPGPAAPALADFPLAADTQAGVDATHDAAGHEVHYDSGRELWYTDVEVGDGGAYRPFVRLALARFQPLSIAGAYIGPIKYLDPIRIGTERLSAVEKKVGGVRVAMAGKEHEGIPDPTVGGTPLRFNRVTAQWQKVDPAISDPDLRWVNEGAATLLTRTTGAQGSIWFKNLVAFPAVADPIRLVLTEHEFQAYDDGTGTLATTYNPVFTEVIEIPADWTA